MIEFIAICLLLLSIFIGIMLIYNIKIKKRTQEQISYMEEERNSSKYILSYRYNKKVYEIGEWDKEIRNKKLDVPSKIEAKYVPNKEVSVLIGDYITCSISNSVYILESMGIKTTMAKSGEEILSRINQNEKYDLIITNNIYNGGSYDGPSLLKELKNIEKFNTPVVVLTVSHNERKSFIYEYGFDEYMTKLLTQKQILTIFPKLIENLKFSKIIKEKKQ